MHVFSYVVEQLVIFLYVLILLMEQFLCVCVCVCVWPKIPLKNPECLCTAFSPSKLYIFWIKFDCI